MYEMSCVHCHCIWQMNCTPPMAVELPIVGRSMEFQDSRCIKIEFVLTTMYCNPNSTPTPIIEEGSDPASFRQDEIVCRVFGPSDFTEPVEKCLGCIGTWHQI